MPRLKTIRKFEEWKADPKNVEELFRLIVEERMSLRDAAMEGVKQPYTLVYPWLHDGGEMQKRYEGVLAAMADDLMHERLKIADSVRKAENPVAVQAAKLACEVREQNARSWGRERYGEAAEAMRGTTVVLQIANLRGAQVSLPGPVKALPDVSDAEQVE